MNILIESFSRGKMLESISETALKQRKRSEKRPFLITGLSDGAKCGFYYSAIMTLKPETGKGITIICPDEKSMENTVLQLASAGLDVFGFYSRDFVFHNYTSSHERENDRIDKLNKILEGEYDAVVTTPEAMLQYTMPRDFFLSSTKKIKSGCDYPISELSAFLSKSGYTRVSMVDGTGQFSVRGSIVDIFSPGYDFPVRADFFGDTLDSLFFFDHLSQRREKKTDSFEILPCREVVADEAGINKISEYISSKLEKDLPPEALQSLKSELESIRGGSELNNIDKYISLVYPKKENLADYLSESSLFVIDDWASVKDSLDALDWYTRETYEKLSEERVADNAILDYWATKEDFMALSTAHPFCILSSFVQNMTDMTFSEIFTAETRQANYYPDKLSLLKEDLEFYIKNGYDILLIAQNKVMAENIKEFLDSSEISSVITPFTDSYPKTVNICYGLSIGGYEDRLSKVAVISPFKGDSFGSLILSGKKHKTNKLSKKGRIMSYADLSVGDYIVHVNHGIGIYRGIERLLVGGSKRDFILLEYAGGSRLFVPTDKLDCVSKYIGQDSDEKTVKLSKLGSPDWKLKTAKAKAAAKEMAKELISLYAARLKRPGFSFNKDDDFQREFEQTFPYEETDGQLEATEEIKEDMEKPVPMDRLLCGDVGFGKTEVALRAAFKAVLSGKQVAILVPTTLLAMQHYQTIQNRMRGFPVSVELLTRFGSQKQTVKSLDRIRRGETDIIVGTHRILSQDISFKDLGLLIIDEEQRFGVAAKEKIKQNSGNIDVLTISATPIPRTLNMSMGGIRDISILEEAPLDRMPVQTYVLEYNYSVVADAIRRELARHGQVFYLHNRIETIDSVAVKVKEMAGESARIAVMHGRMDKDEISRIWKKMVDGDIDILVCTTIIESGIDIPNANTLIIENAERLGLAQLHQIKGRVGRSSRKAYAYITFPPGKALSEDSSKRLKAIREFTEFGSGFKVALRDLEIRGAGSLLGAEQHGHLADIGYDMYMKILNEAVLEERGIKEKEKPEAKIEINVDAYIPEKYIYSQNERIDAYKKISLIEKQTDANDIKEELTDRYGKIPSCVNSLIDISLLRATGGRVGFNLIKKRGSSYYCYSPTLDKKACYALAAETRGMILLSAGAEPYLCIKVKSDGEEMKTLLNILNRYGEISGGKSEEIT